MSCGVIRLSPTRSGSDARMRATISSTVSPSTSASMTSTSKPSRLSTRRDVEDAERLEAVLRLLSGKQRGIAECDLHRGCGGRITGYFGTWGPCRGGVLNMLPQPAGSSEPGVAFAEGAEPERTTAGFSHFFRLISDKSSSWTSWIATRRSHWWESRWSTFS